MKTILTGLRVNSEFTLGNYLGALLPMVRLANKYKNDYNVNIFVPDLHSIISEVDGELQQNIIRSIKIYFAAGLIANENVHIYRQSYVPAHSELCWILNCTVPMGELSRMTQFKEKSDGKSSVNAGILNYPILMAADILLYDAEYVPVGEDQFQHLELARNIATRINHKFEKEIFVPPVETRKQVEFMEIENGIRIRDLVNPEKKMSKSARSENSKIMMSDDPAVAAKKIMSATTDSVGKIQYDMFNQPGVSNLLQIEALVNDVPLQDVISTWAGETRYGDLKQKVASSVRTMLEAFQERMAEIPDETVIEYLEAGEEYANSIANAKLLEVQHVFNLR